MIGYMNMNMTLFHGIAMFIFWFVLIFLLFSIFTKENKKEKESALDILKKRLAKGEISKEQYEDIKKSII